MNTFPTAELEGAEGYKLLTGLIVPRPIGWVGSRSVDGADNLAPYSFFNAVSGDPPTVVVSPGDAGRKDTRTNILDTGEFTVSIVSLDMVVQMNATAASAQAGVSEFELADVTPVEGQHVNAAYVGECKAALECRMTHHLHVGRVGGGNRLIVGEVVAFHIDDELLDGSRIDQAGLRAVGRHAGDWYSATTELFDITRPS